MSNGRPILLVEDNPDDEALALHAFSKNRITNQVIVAHDGVEALDYLFGTGAFSAHKPELPAVVLLDLKLPRIDGLEVLRRIRAESRTTLLPVVILTTSREALDMQQAYNLGANSYVRKPVDFERFMHLVGVLGEYWLNINESADASTNGAY